MSAYAKHRAVKGLPGGTLYAVQVAIAKGRLSSRSVTRDKKIRSAEVADAEWAANTRADRVPMTGPTSVPDADGAPTNPLAEARLRHETARATSAELELRRLQGELVPLAEVRAEVAQRYTVVRTRLLGVPARVKQRAPHLSAGDVALIDDLVREALEELADGDGAAAQQPIHEAI